MWKALEAQKRTADATRAGAEFRRVWAVAGGTGSITFPLDKKGPQEGVVMPQIQVEGGIFRPHAITSDGKRLAGIALSSSGSRFGIGWHDLSTGETWVSKEGPDVGVPAWLDDRQIVYPANSRQMVVIDMDKKRRVIGGPYPFDFNPALMAAVSPDRRMVFVGAGTAETDVWMVERAKR